MKKFTCFLIGLIFSIGALTGPVAAQKVDGQAKNVPPVKVPGEPTCAEAGIPSQGQIKFIGPIPLGQTIHNFIPDAQWIRTGAAPSNPEREVNLERYHSPNPGTADRLRFHSEVQITGTVVGNGANSHVYNYGLGGFATDQDLSAPDNLNPTSITFCYRSGTTAADSSVEGIVLKLDGTPIANAVVSVRNATTGIVIEARTNAEGMYKIENLETGDLYQISVRRKQHSFTEPSKTRTLDDSIKVHFVANQ